MFDIYRYVVFFKRFYLTNKYILMKKFKIGDVVKLKSGSHAMTVGGKDPKNKSKIICNWDVNGVIKEKSFFEDQLEIVDDLEHIRDLLDGIEG